MEVRELSPDERGAFVQSAYFVWERIGRIFPDAIYDLLLGGDLVGFAPERAVDSRAQEQRFAIADIVDAIDGAVDAVRTSATEAASQAHDQAPALRSLAEAAATMSDESGALAERFSDLLSRFATAQDDVASARELVRALAVSALALAPV